MEANTPLHLFLHSTLHTLIGFMSLLYQDIIIHRHYNVRIRAIARARVCVCGKTASCASLQVSPLHHLIKGAEKTKETTRE